MGNRSSIEEWLDLAEESIEISHLDRSKLTESELIGHQMADEYLVRLDKSIDCNHSWCICDNGHMDTLLQIISDEISSVFSRVEEGSFVLRRAPKKSHVELLQLLTMLNRATCEDMVDSASILGKISLRKEETSSLALQH